MHEERVEPGSLKPRFALSRRGRGDIYCIFEKAGYNLICLFVFCRRAGPVRIASRREDRPDGGLT